MKTIATLTENEHTALQSAYMQANSTDKDVDWKLVADIYNKLGKKYHFVPANVTIDMRGNVSKIPTIQYVMAILKYHGDDKPELYVRKIITSAQIAKIKRIFK